MNSTSLRREVLRSFKNLHRARCSVFRNSKHILESARKEINNGFRKNIHVKNEDSIKELIKFADEVAVELRRSIAELEEVTPGHFRLKLRPEMFKEYQSVIEKKGEKDKK